MRKVIAASKLFARLKRDERGIAALEFALVMPVLLLIYLGSFELTRLISAHEKLTLFTRTLADLAGRADHVSPSDTYMQTVARASTAIMRPFDTSEMQIVVSAMGVRSVHGNLIGGVCSSWAQNGIQRPAQQVNGSNGLPPTPAAYQVPGAHYILAEVTMPYKPVLGSALYAQFVGSEGLILTRQIPWAQRALTEVIMAGGTACPGNS